MNSWIKTATTLLVGSIGVALIGLLRQKILAVLVGPIGIGVIGYLAAFVAFATTVSVLGLNNSAVRFVALAHAQGVEARRSTVSSLLTVGAVMAVAGGLGAWALLHMAQALGLRDLLLDHGVVVGVAIGFGIVASIRVAIINGLQRPRDYMLVNLIGTLLSTVMVIGVLWAFGEAFYLVAVVGPPLGNAVVSWWLTRTIARVWGAGQRQNLWQTLQQVKPMVIMGLATYGGGLILVSTQFLARLVVQDSLTAVELGLFQAVWSISGLYLAFLLNAFVVDFYPKMSTADGDDVQQAALIMSQTRHTIHLVLPIILVFVLAAPLLIRGMFTEEFMPMLAMLRWQLAGDVFKLAAWGLSYTLLAKNQSKTYSLGELFWGLSYFSGLALFVKTFGLEGAGLVYVCAYGLYFLLLLRLVARKLPALKAGRMAATVCTLAALALIVAFLAEWGGYGMLAAGALAASVCVLVAVDALRSGTYDGALRRVKQIIKI